MRGGPLVREGLVEVVEVAIPITDRQRRSLQSPRTARQPAGRQPAVSGGQPHRRRTARGGRLPSRRTSPAPQLHRNREAERFFAVVTLQNSCTMQTEPWYYRESQSLSNALAKRRRHIDKRVAAVTHELLLQRAATALANEILDSRDGEADSVGHPMHFSSGLQPTQQIIGSDAELRGESYDQRISCFSFSLVFKWTGAPDLLGMWPDAEDTGLTRYTSHGQHGKPPIVHWEISVPSSGSVLVAHCYATRSPALRDDAAQSDWDALALTWEQERATHPTDLYAEAAEFVHAYCEAANRQISAWELKNADDLVREFEGRQRLAAAGRDSRDQSNHLLAKWRTPSLKQAKPNLTVAERPVELGEPRHRLPDPLDDASLVDLIRITNRWVRSVEKYNAAFLPLEEERISDLLVATLNGAFGRAEREVFTGGARSDFYVSANVFGEDGNANVFAGEAKYWKGTSSFMKAVKQTLNYLTQDSRDAVLLVLVRDRRSFSRSKATALKAMQKLEGCKPIADIATRPAYSLPSRTDPSESVRLCLVLVDMTRVAADLPDPKAPAG